MLEIFALTVFTAIVVAKCSPTFKRDLNAARMLVTMKIMYAWYTWRGFNIPLLWQKTVEKDPEKIALVEAHTQRKFTFKEIDELSNQFAWVLKKYDVKPSSVVAIMMPNCMEYVASWLGAVKLGCTAALVNTMFEGHSLVHALKICEAKAIIVHEDFLPALEEIFGELPSGVAIFGYQLTNYASKGDIQLVDMAKETLLSNKPPPAEYYQNLTFNSPTLMLYTSGTSGNNKVVKISGFKTHFMGWSMANLCGFSSSDIFYTPLPLFHGNGGGMCLGQMLWRGSTVVIRDKFSASKFWLDVSAHKATVINYIGEIGSYLLAQPERPDERSHDVNFAIGNGLSQSVWSKMKSRFGIKRIVEFYASTEGNCNLVNSEGHLGACGFIPGGLAKRFFPVNLIKCDPQTMEPERTSVGLCKLVEPGEVGQIVGKIRNDYLSRFEGYSDGDASRRKIINDVFRRGDAAFISGDLLRIDENGWCYFVQRVADCYRINGENITSTMIEDHMNKLLNFKYTVASTFTEIDKRTFGVLVMKFDLAQVTEKDLEKKTMEIAEVISRLPKYARPTYVRLTNDIPITPTMKVKKFALQKRGVDTYKDDIVLKYSSKTQKLTTFISSK